MVGGWRMRWWGWGELGRLRARKSFFQKTLEARRGAFWLRMGRVEARRDFGWRATAGGHAVSPGEGAAAGACCWNSDGAGSLTSSGVKRGETAGRRASGERVAKTSGLVYTFRELTARVTSGCSRRGTAGREPRARRQSPDPVAADRPWSASGSGGRRAVSEWGQRGDDPNVRSRRTASEDPENRSIPRLADPGERSPRADFPGSTRRSDFRGPPVRSGSLPPASSS